MTASTAHPLPRRVRRRCRSLLGRTLGLLCAAGLIATACGSTADSQDLPVAGQGAAPERLSADDAAILRPHEGISAAGGNLDVVGGSSACSGDDMIDIVYLGPDLARLDEIGLEELVIEEPSLLIDAYVEALNALGGIHGRCIRATAYLWDPADATGSVGQICDEMAASRPLFVLNFLGNVDGINCATLDHGIVTLGLYASAPSESTIAAEGRLFLDDGTHAYLLENSIEVALRAGHLSPDAQLGFLRGAGSGADDQIAAMRALMAPGGLLSLIDKYGMDVGSVGHVPGAFSEWSTLRAEKQLGLLRADLSEAEQSAAQEARDTLDPEIVDRLGRIEDFYLDAAADYLDAGVDVMVSTASWIEMRRLMRAAELTGWNPWWIASDTQGATLTLIGAPANQARRFVHISARRAAGDEVPALDRGCVLLRNTTAGAVPFSHRHHTDAWSVITATCDLLDVAFSALSRTPVPLDGDAFAAAMHHTDYQTAHGGRITYGPEDPSGADRFRVLEADPDCVLDDWGCMRALTDWLAPVAEARVSAG
ncbi:MAG: hypothetical protein OXM54_01055 [Acidimicrobiaceae bacterium]|nr:hypothetical protein [Acidimicrobiaceae bacterium]